MQRLSRRVSRLRFAVLLGAVAALAAGSAPAAHAADRIYWGNVGTDGDKISFANLDTSGGGDLTILTATVSVPALPALLNAPSGTGAPLVSGGSARGSALSCSPGSWAADLSAALLYRAPQSLAYSWSRDGQAIAGASASTYTAGVAGAYRCTVSATNEAGTSAPQTSAAHSVAAGFGAKTLVTLSPPPSPTGSS